jgi:hypothetical protein
LSGCGLAWLEALQQLSKLGFLAQTAGYVVLRKYDGLGEDSQEAARARP